MVDRFPGDWDDLVILAGGETWGDIWGSHRHLAEALSQERPVLYVDTPVSPLTHRRRTGVVPPGLRLERPGLAVLVPPALPGLSRPGIRWTTHALTRRAIRGALKDLGSPRVGLLVVTGLDDLFRACDAGTKVLYATDDFAAGAELMGIGRRYLEAGERRAAAMADRVVVVSDHLAGKWRRLGHEPIVIPNGCDPAAFAHVDEAPVPDDVPLTGPTAGMVGRLSARVDLPMLEAVADDGVSLLLVGPRHDDFEPDRVDRLLARPNVCWVGPKRFDELPSYLRVIDVGLTPYADTEFNRASSPLKALEYLAAGRASVASDLPATRLLDGDHVQIASGPRSFVAEVRAALDRPRTPELVAQRRAVAQSNSWTSRAHQFLARTLDVPRENQVTTP